MRNKNDLGGKRIKGGVIRLTTILPISHGKRDVEAGKRGCSLTCVSLRQTNT